MNIRLTKNLHWFLLILVFILLVSLSFLSNGFYGGADNLNHYFISRYAFKYPDLFLNTWGRPVFNILSSPFSQFGFKGLKLFNVMLGCLSAFLAFLTARRLGISRPWLVILFVVFTPIYLLMTLTGLTEILFGFILILSVYLFFDEKYIAAAIIVSFLPLARSEGIVLLPFFFFALLIKKKYSTIPFLAAAFLIFSIIGYFFVYHDFFWLITHSPYPLHHPVYKEKGPLLHFIDATPQIFGIPLLILFLAGTGFYASLLLKADKKDRLQIFLEIWMLVLPVFLFFLVHSVLYWKALFGSIGLVRVVTGVLPVAAIVSLKAFDQLEKTVFKTPILRNAFLAVLILFLLFSAFSLNHYPVKPDLRDRTLRNATRWVEEKNLAKQKILFTDLDIPFLLDLDPYDKTRCDQIYSPEWLTSYPDSTVFIWDAYFGTVESEVPPEQIEETKCYKLINIFRSDQYPESGNGQGDEINIFIKVPAGSSIDNVHLRDSIMTSKRETGSVRFISGNTFEKKGQNIGDNHILSEVARSGSCSYKVNGFEEFALSKKIELSKIIARESDVTIRVSCFIYPLVPFNDNDTRLVVTLKDRNDFYQSLSLAEVAKQSNQWNKVTFLATFPAVKPSDNVMVYFWHLGKKEFYVDDLKTESVNLKTTEW